jgi:single-strand DNA-binding protein
MLGVEVRSVVTPDDEHVNEVRLSGRVSGEPQGRELPSGDRLLSVRIVVPRPPHRRRGRGATVDTIDCVAWTSRPRAVLAAMRVGDIVLVEGALRRRFWRGQHGLASKMEVDVSRAKRIRKAASQRAESKEG